MSSLLKLQEALSRLPSGIISQPADDYIETLIIESWGSIEGSSQQSTFSEKLIGRIENLQWNPPILSFEIERHGATVLGSKKAAIHSWSVNVETAEAQVNTQKSRLKEKRSRSLDVQPLADTVVANIDNRICSSELRWISPCKVSVLIGKIIPPNGPKETVQRRRRRFARILNAKLESIGWRKVLRTSPYVYERSEP